MSIHPKAIEEFILRKRKDHSWMKKLSNKDLDRALEEVGFKPASKKPLLKHQKVCILLGIAYKCFIFWLDMGTGKTRVSLELLNYWWKNGELDYAIIQVLSEPGVVEWEDQIREWNIKIPYITLMNSSTKLKWEIFEELDNGGLIICTYPGLVRMVSSLKKVPGRKNRKLTIDEKLLKRLSSKVQALILDEATAIGHKNLSYKVNTKLAKTANIRYELAGIPFGRDPMMLWTQYDFIDKGETLGASIGLFREAFFREKINFWGAKEYKFKKNLLKDLNRIVRNLSITYGEGECFDLPPLVAKVEEVALPQEPAAYYRRFADDLLRKNASFSERQNAFIRMRQVSSGFVGFKNDDTGERAEISFAVNPKLDRLMELIQAMPSKRKFIVFYEFIHSGKVITDALKKAGIKVGWMRGGMKDAKKVKESFNNDDSMRGLVVNHKLGAFSLNLQRANYVFFYESPVPVIPRKQAERRARRGGQNRTVFQYDLVCKGTMDARILDFHKEGRDLWEAIRRSPHKALKKAA